MDEQKDVRKRIFAYMEQKQHKTWSSEEEMHQKEDRRFGGGDDGEEINSGGY